MVANWLSTWCDSGRHHIWNRVNIQLLDSGNTLDCHLWKHFRLSSIFGKRKWAVPAKRLVREWHLSVTCLRDGIRKCGYLYLMTLTSLACNKKSTFERWCQLPTSCFLFKQETLRCLQNILTQYLINLYAVSSLQPICGVLKLLVWDFILIAEKVKESLVDYLESWEWLPEVFTKYVMWDLKRKKKCWSCRNWDRLSTRGWAKERGRRRWGVWALYWLTGGSELPGLTGKRSRSQMRPKLQWHEREKGHILEWLGNALHIQKETIKIVLNILIK